MAKKKPRTPPPPRKVQAPQRRVDKKTPRAPGAGFAFNRTYALVALVALLVVGGIVGIVVAVSGGGGGSVDKKVALAMAKAGCTFRSVAPIPPKDKTNFHADFPTPTTPTKGKWSTFPPSGGAHYQFWAVWGFYTQAVNPRRVVHNMEHGGVVLWWGPKVPQTTVDKLQAFYSADPVGMVGTPLEGLDSKVAISDWTGDPARYYRNGYYGIGHLAVCPGFDEAAFKTFRDAYRGHGPEGIPLSVDQPGSGPQG